MPAEETNAARPDGTGTPDVTGTPDHSTDSDAPKASDAPKVSDAPKAPKGHQARKPAGGPGRPADPRDTSASEDSGGSRGARDPGGGRTEDPADITVRDPVSAPDASGRPRRVTRRFPLFTRDTARPEGGGRAAARDAPAPARQWPVLAVVLLVGLGLLLTALDVFRWGTLLIGAALLGGAVLRWMVPDVGMLAVRSRFTDITTYGVLGLSIALLALMAQPNPVLEIPFLKDTLHFTVS
ncbi:DUF3017 domain-containing protein [Streptomyces sp. NPDC048187]|uniref:DUF3017 domain-containing protein n=1 Tax=Streptomyces sp. NPDC048187 TaxID=3365509 RepID=UPI0037186C7D